MTPIVRCLEEGVWPKDKNGVRCLRTKIGVLVEVLNERSTEGQEVHTLVEEEGDNWMTPIVRCLKEGVWTKDKNEARCLRTKIGQYAMKSGVLFKKGMMMLRLRCKNVPHAKYTLR
ncbi:hypothetical protein Tco_0440475, partial [Tanacetum coccineum]